MCVSADTASLTSVDRVGQRTNYASDDVAAKADQLQYDMGFGPCLTALQAAELVTVPDLTADIRWPEWSKAARQLGVSGVLSVPFGGSANAQSPTGTLNLYWFDWFGIRAYSAEDVQAARLMAKHVATLLYCHTTQDVQS